MRKPSVNCAVFLASAAVFFAAGCNGGLPSSGWVGTGVFSAGSDPCDMKDEWSFGGPCAHHALPAGGWTYRLSKYRGYALTVALSKNNGNGTTTIYGSDATGKGDISGTYKGTSFPIYGKNCYENSRKITCPGKAFLFLKVTSTNTKQIDLDASPAATVTSLTGYSGTKCFPAFLESGWDVREDLAEAPKGDTVSLQLGSSSKKQYIAPHAFYNIAFVCS